MRTSTRVTMIGSGYVGLVSGACFSDFGHDVICVDKDPARIEALLAGRMPIYEPSLDQLVSSNVAAGRLTFTTDLSSAVAGADAIFIALAHPRGAATAMPILATCSLRRKKLPQR